MRIFFRQKITDQFCVLCTFIYICFIKAYSYNFIKVNIFALNSHMCKFYLKSKAYRFNLTFFYKFNIPSDFCFNPALINWLR